MNFKKTIAKSLVVAMALGMVPVANLQTAKAVAQILEVKFDGTTGIATADDAKFWGIAKEDKAKGKGSVRIGSKNYKISNIKEYADGIDAYAALKGKAGVIVAGKTAVPDDKWGVVELPAAENTFKVYIAASTAAVKGFTPDKKYGGEYGYLFASIGKQPKGVDLSASGEAIEVKLNEGNWQTLKKFFTDVKDEKVTEKLKMLSQNGSTLTFRVMGTNKTWASKESKVKVAAQPKAPNVKVDITKETTSIKNGMEYRVVKAGTEVDNVAWKVSTNKKGLSFTDLQLGAESKDVYVRTAASGKKLASAVTKVTINKGVEKLSLPGSGFTATGATIANVARVEANVYYDVKKGASLYNLSPEDLEWTLVGKDGKYKWSTLKASKNPEKKPSKVALKYSATEKPNTWGVEGVKLYLRRSGVKQNKNGVATQSGVSDGAVMNLTNVTQSFKFVKDNNVVKQENTTMAAIEVATGTAATFTFKGKVTGFVGTKAGSAKVKKVKDLPKGITYKVGKIDPDSGEFEITVNVGKLKDKVTETTAEFGFEFQGIKSGFKIKVSPKN